MIESDSCERSVFISKSEFQEEKQKGAVEQRKKKEFLPSELLSQIPLDPDKRNQEFYRLNMRIGQKNQLIKKLGWRIACLSRDQQDLAVYCFSLFQTEVSFPIKIYSINQDYRSIVGSSSCEEGATLSSKDLWMQTQILLSGISIGEDQQWLEYSVYKFCKDVILQSFRSFIASHINWAYMISQSYSDSFVIEQFEMLVIRPIKTKLKSYRISSQVKT